MGKKRGAMKIEFLCWNNNCSQTKTEQKMVLIVAVATKYGRMEKSMACNENMSSNSQGETPSYKYFMAEHTKRLRICIAAAHNIAESSFAKVLDAAAAAV